jgi:hypothetical protein
MIVPPSELLAPDTLPGMHPAPAAAIASVTIVKTPGRLSMGRSISISNCGATNTCNAIVYNAM